MPLLTAIVLNYRSPKDSLKCVRALLEQTIANDMEILLVDNHSVDESIGTFRATFREHPKVRIIETADNIGYGKGNNTAIRYASGEYVLIINPDNILPPDGAEKLITILNDHPHAGIVGPALVYPDGTVRPSARPYPTITDLIRKRLFPHTWHEQYARTIDPLSSQAQPVDWLVGACLLMRTELFRELGGFDPRFFLFFEDIDLCRRCHQLGNDVLFAPTVRIADRKRRLSEGGLLSLLTKRTARIHLWSAVLYFWKWRSV